MANQLQVFKNEEFGKIEVLMIDGKPHFPAVECAEKLGYSKPHNAISRHCVHSLKRGVVTKTTNQYGFTSDQSVEKTYIPEGDLYRLIIRSKLPSAERFERWVFDEVLPTLRKHGAYITEEVLDEILHSQEFAFDLFKKLAAERQKTAALETLAEELAPKAIYCDLILRCKNAISISVIARDYGMTATAFNRLLHSLRIQFKVSGTWLLYREHANKGYTKTSTYCVGDEVASVFTRWTQAGRLFLYEKLKSYGYLPLMESQQTVLH